MMENERSAAQLVISIARYSEAALAEVYRRHGGAVYGIAGRVLISRNRETAGR